MPSMARIGQNGSAGERNPLLPQPNSHLYTDERPYIRWPAQVLHKTWQTLSSNYVNVLLVFVPLGIASGLAGWSPTTTFILNFLAIMPLAALLSFATEELSAKLGETLGGLLNATFGNAVELIVSMRSTGIGGHANSLHADQHRRFERRRNSHRAVQHAWKHPFQHTPCKSRNSKDVERR